MYFIENKANTVICTFDSFSFAPDFRGKYFVCCKFHLTITKSAVKCCKDYNEGRINVELSTFFLHKINLQK
jgi:hypothetical protein